MAIDHSAMLPHLEVGATKEDAELSVILMHGLGADGYDFADVAEMLSQAALPRRWRFVLPHAPAMPVTINMGMAMPAWYDIISLTHPREVNWDTVAASQKNIEAFIADEPAEKVVLAGFSQGAAMALHVGLRHPQKIAGILMMSGYLMESDDHQPPASQGELPIGILHGTVDDVVTLDAAKTAKQSLEAAGYSPTFKSYPGLGHSVSDPEIRDVLKWLQQF